MLTSATRIHPNEGAQKKTTIQPRKTPVQRRSVETVAAILEASAHILEKEGLRRFNTNVIAVRAGISIGSLYQFFPGKDAILAALIAQYETAMLARFEETFANVHGMSLDRNLQCLAKTMVKVHRDRPALYRVLEAAEDRLIDNTSPQHVDQQLRKRMTELLREHRVVLPERRMEEAAQDVLSISRALVNGALARGETRWRNVDRRLFRAVKGYLFG